MARDWNSSQWCVCGCDCRRMAGRGGYCRPEVFCGAPRSSSAPRTQQQPLCHALISNSGGGWFHQGVRTDETPHITHALFVPAKGPLPVAKEVILATAEFDGQRFCHEIEPASIPACVSTVFGVAVLLCSSCSILVHSRELCCIPCYRGSFSSCLRHSSSFTDASFFCVVLRNTSPTVLRPHVLL